MEIDLAKAVDWNDSYAGREAYIGNVMKDNGYTWLGTGRHRMTYLSPNKRFVLKFPTCCYGIQISKREDALWSMFHWEPTPNGTYVAPCRMIGGVILMMRAMVELYGDSDSCDIGREVLGQSSCDSKHEIPSWAERLDCGQVGRLANGRIVAYDFGSDG
jgi:hypothetical protein